MERGILRMRLNNKLIKRISLTLMLVFSIILFTSCNNENKYTEYFSLNFNTGSNSIYIIESMEDYNKLIPSHNGLYEVIDKKAENIDSFDINYDNEKIILIVYQLYQYPKNRYVYEFSLDNNTLNIGIYEYNDISKQAYTYVYYMIKCSKALKYDNIKCTIKNYMVYDKTESILYTLELK